jgi:hypothetical protein
MGKRKIFDGATPGVKGMKSAHIKMATSKKVAEETANSKIPWHSNRRWTDCLVAHLLENTDLRIKLFSDSTTKAKAEDHSKVVPNHMCRIALTEATRLQVASPRNSTMQY